MWIVDESIDAEQIKLDTITEVFGNFDEYMNGNPTNEEMKEYKHLLHDRFQEMYTESNTRMLKLIEDTCGSFEVQFFGTSGPLCIIKMNNTQIGLLADSQIPVYYEEIGEMNITAELE